MREDEDNDSAGNNDSSWLTMTARGKKSEGAKSDQGDDDRAVAQ